MASWTQAITIDAAPEHVWPWLAQLGAGRGGWYSYDFLDNGGRPSAESILPEFQTVEAGVVLPAVPGATDAFVIASVEPPRLLILTAPSDRDPPIVSWAFVLEPREGGTTRLVVRARAAEAWRELARSSTSPEGVLLVNRIYRLLGRLPRPLLVGAAAQGHAFMERRMLRGIERRAAHRSLSRPGTPPAAYSG